ncbi:hypothetical protein [Dysgonomonas sp. BGC7]|uniref:hypothetical protein n=1 Tax=Dysgonomonas sp. BGC7 TaxID=1658008 RepID=UPI00068110DD|nr:hypothetical protein [Dysgonomonas sp. BGC7]MBD8389810.1 hypothetical protein [Dysgonomonas sp. BGC7]
MDIQQLYQIIQGEADNNKYASDISELKNIITEYPYFQAGLFAYLRSLYISDFESFEDELHRVSIFINDRKALFYYIFSEEYSQYFEKTTKKEISEDKTSVLLNAFFDSRGENQDEHDNLEYGIFHTTLASTDYFSYVQSTHQEEQTDTPDPEISQIQLKHQNIIDSFITKSESEEGISIQLKEENEQVTALKNETEEENSELNEDVFFTETLAKIYIKQKKYEKAYKIIKHLSLNYPKKNIYFADQLSFLEKLIINTKFKDTK